MSKLSSLLHLNGKAALITGASCGIGLTIISSYRLAVAPVCADLESTQRKLEPINAQKRVDHAGLVASAASSEGTATDHCEEFRQRHGAWSAGAVPLAWADG